MKIAIIGTGIAGLTACYELQKLNHKLQNELAEKHFKRNQNLVEKIVLYEARSTYGLIGDSFSIDIDQIQSNRCLEKGVVNDDNCSKDSNTKMNSKHIYNLDMPLRVFSEKYYSNMTRIFHESGIEYSCEDYSGSFTFGNENIEAINDASTSFVYDNICLSLPTLSHLKNYIFGNITTKNQNNISIPFFKNLKSQKCFFSNFQENTSLIYQQFQFLKIDAPSLLKQMSIEKQFSISLEEYLDIKNYSKSFKNKFMLPIISAILTCSIENACIQPIGAIAEYLVSRSLGGVCRAKHGLEDVAKRLIHPNFRTMCTKKCNCFKICQIEKRFDEEGRVIKIDIITQSEKDTFIKVEDASGSTQFFDHVIIATQSNQCRSFFQLTNKGEENKNFNKYKTEIVSALDKIKYEKPIELVVHMDPSLMPSDTNLWRSVNFWMPKSISQSNSKILEHNLKHNKGAEATIQMNRVGAVRKQTNINMTKKTPNIFQTQNPLRSPKPEYVLKRRFYERPLLRSDSDFENKYNIRKDFQKRFQGKHNIQFCGAWIGNSLPLLENGVESAVDVVKQIYTKISKQNQNFKDESNINEAYRATYLKTEVVKPLENDKIVEGQHLYLLILALIAFIIRCVYKLI